MGVLNMQECRTHALLADSCNACWQVPVADYSNACWQVPFLFHYRTRSTPQTTNTMYRIGSLWPADALLIHTWYELLLPMQTFADSAWGLQLRSLMMCAHQNETVDRWRPCPGTRLLSTLYSIPTGNEGFLHRSGMCCPWKLADLVN